MANDSRSLRDEERQWFNGIRELLLRDDLETAITSPPFIFQLPESVRTANPDAFLPRRIAFGPLNFNNNMQSYKLHMAKKAQEDLHLPQFDQLICHQLRPLELRIRACYDTHLEIGGDNLAWIMLVDALFLLRLFLNISAQMENYNVSLRLPLPNFDDQNLFDSNHEKLVAQFLIMSDVLKLENQIPLLVFKGILCTTLNVTLPVFLYHFCKSVSPFAFRFFRPSEIIDNIDPSTFDWEKPLAPDFSEILDQSHHLLHFMYFSTLIFPTYNRVVLFGGASTSPKWMRILRSVLDSDFIQQLNEVIVLIKEFIELIGSVRKQIYAHKTTSFPVIPPASQLQKFHVIFWPTDKGILLTKFIKVRATLILPVFTVNAFTETLFENLVAFEAMANINPPVFARYLQLMKALIPTPEDLNILKKAGIIYSDLDNDEEVVKLFKRVGSSISTLKKPSIKNLNHLHRSYEASTSEPESEAKNGIFEEINEKYEEGLKGMVEEINQYYESFWIVKVEAFVKKYKYCVVKILAILVVLFQIFLVVARLISSIGNDEPNYQMAPT